MKLIFYLAWSLLIFYQLFSISAASSEVRPFRDDYIYVSEHLAYYKAHPGQTDWYSASLICLSEGAELAVPLSTAEARTIVNVIGANMDIVWVGFSDILTEGKWITQNGIALSGLYNNWHKDEPNIESEDCAFLNSDLTLYDQQCDRLHNFVCKKELAKIPLCDRNDPDVEILIRESYRSDYKHMPEFSAFYKPHQTELDWHSAMLTCASEGAELATPLSLDEGQTIARNFPGRIIWVGFSDIIYEGIWMMPNGTFMVNVYKNNWHAGEPNFESEDCAFIVMDGSLYDENCFRTYPFVCKKKNEIGLRCPDSKDKGNKLHSIDENERKRVLDEAQRNKLERSRARERSRF